MARSALDTILLGLFFLGVCLLIWRVARRAPDLRTKVCSGHGGDGIARCRVCERDYCDICVREAHCAPEDAREGPWAGSL